MQTTRRTKKEIVTIVDARIREAHVTREDFSEFKGIVKELGVKVGELAGEMKVFAVGLDRNREEVGGLSRSFSYAFENETYRVLPAVVKAKYGIDIKEKFIMTNIGGKEINIFGRAEKEGNNSNSEF